MPLTSVAEPTTRDAILDEAETRFAERGFDGTSMRDVAAAAGLRNQASLYHYFANKQAMYEAVLARGVASVLQALTAGQGASPGAVAPYLDDVLNYLGEHPQMARLIHRASLDDNLVTRDLVTRVVQPLYDEGLLLLANAGTPWSAEDLPHLAAGLYHLIFGYYADAALLRTVMRDDPTSAAALERQRRFVHHAVRRLLGEERMQGATP